VSEKIKQVNLLEPLPYEEETINNIKITDEKIISENISNPDDNRNKKDVQISLFD
jgi:hypothetical protein